MKIQDIARLANVSVATVSRVINNNDNVKEELVFVMDKLARREN